METQSRLHSKGQVVHAVGWTIVGAYVVLLTLYIVPFYNPAYRVIVGLLSNLFSVLAAAAIGCVLVPLALFRRRLRKALLFLGLGIVLFLATRGAYHWRRAWTERQIQTRYCQESETGTTDIVLGGITHTEGLFINDTHCLFVACPEEFYTCEQGIVQP